MEPPIPELRWKVLRKELRRKDGSMVLFGMYKLGSGSFSQGVYKAKSRKLGQIAVKITKTKDVYLEREAYFLKELRHENIITCFSDVKRTSAFSYLVLEYVNGCDLLTFLTERTPPVPRQKLARTTSDFILLGRRHIAECTLKALSYLHENGIIHNDLKPENIVVSAATLSKVNCETKVKLIDFGLSYKLADKQSSALASAGSMDWVAPEKAGEDITDIGTAGDIYSFGLVFYALMTTTSAYHVPSTESRMEMYIFIETQINAIQRRVVDGEHGLLERTDVKAVLLSCIKVLPSKRKTAEALLRCDFFQKI